MVDPGNLSRRAERDLADIVERSTGLYGLDQADAMEGEILRRCREIGQGRGLGHIRPDAPKGRAFRFWPVPPFVIVYDAKTRLVVRVLHGRRDVPAVLR